MSISHGTMELDTTSLLVGFGKIIELSCHHIHKQRYVLSVQSWENNSMSTLNKKKSIKKKTKVWQIVRCSKRRSYKFWEH